MVFAGTLFRIENTFHRLRIKMTSGACGNM